MFFINNFFMSYITFYFVDPLSYITFYFVDPLPLGIFNTNCLCFLLIIFLCHI
ncbi:hypothetical protein Hanom_Chr08g00756611 [Helianthus anomalus]